MGVYVKKKIERAQALLEVFGFVVFNTLAKIFNSIKDFNTFVAKNRSALMLSKSVYVLPAYQLILFKTLSYYSLSKLTYISCREFNSFFIYFTIASLSQLMFLFTLKSSFLILYSFYFLFCLDYFQIATFFKLFKFFSLAVKYFEL